MTLDTATLLEMQRRMLRIRHFDERASKMVKRGQIPGTVHTSIGQEAQVVGACMALADGDYMTGDGKPGGGVELMMEKHLEGTPGKQTFELGRDGTIIPVAASSLEPAVDGNDVTLTRYQPTGVTRTWDGGGANSNWRPRRCFIHQSEKLGHG